ncbi:hypothetical protein C8T65DRAFT_84048 [Cerioporus squamosus]|nr:hypothetical protein C8T65DRAFT_84048 [Cerioporus squamosus]
MRFRVSLLLLAFHLSFYFVSLVLCLSSLSSLYVSMSVSLSVHLFSLLISLFCLSAFLLISFRLPRALVSCLLPFLLLPSS